MAKKVIVLQKKNYVPQSRGTLIVIASSRQDGRPEIDRIKIVENEAKKEKMS